MAYREVEPHRALRPFVDRLWVRAGGEAGDTARILPDGCMDLLLRLDGGVGVAVGTMTRARVVHLPARQRVVAVRFRPGGAAPFLGVAAHELTDRQVRFEDLALGWLEMERFDCTRDPQRVPNPPRSFAPNPGPPGPSAGTGWSKLGGSAREPRGPLAEAVAALQRSLLARLPAAALPDRRVAAAVRELFGEGPPPVERLARDLGFSRQHLARVFRDQVGVGPKVLARIARVQRALRSLQAGPETSLAQAAAEVGFFDEAHMDRDFRALVGITPGQAQAARGSIRPIPSLLAEGMTGV